MTGRFDIRLSKEEKAILRHTAHYFEMTMTELVRQWIKYDGNEEFLKEWRSRFA